MLVYQRVSCSQICHAEETNAFGGTPCCWEVPSCPAPTGHQIAHLPATLRAHAFPVMGHTNQEA